MVRKGEMSIKHASEVESHVVEAGNKTSMQVLISSQEGPNFALRRFVIQPGGGMPSHTNKVEHEQYVLGGHARIGIGAETFDVRSGDVLFIPQGISHWYKNVGEEAFEFLCAIPNKEDRITLLEQVPC
jgi:quercetin dioxygenase-like cupin family protein